MKSPAVLTASLLAMSFSPSQTAKASDIGLDFSLPAPNRPASSTQAKASNAAEPKTLLQPLQIPPQAAQPPISSSTLPPPPTVYREGDRLAIAATITSQGLTATLPPPPPTLPQKQDIAPDQKPRLIALHFNLDDPPAARPPAPFAREEEDTPQAHDPTSSPVIFQGGVNSLVAKAIGSAEGTRTPEGHRTAAYYGHIDPGNRVWNLGTFSYQHGALTPEDADERQLKRLQAQTQRLDQRANTNGLTLTLEEKLNGIDLVNQAPSAALGRDGYLEWLSKAHQLGMTGSDAILWSRTRAFLDPDTQRWNAPGLGNTVSSISRDQERRMRAIGRAMAFHQPQPAPVTATKPEMALPPTAGGSQDIAIGPPKPKAEAADIIFSVSLQPSEIASQTTVSALRRNATPPLADQSPVRPDSSSALTLESSPATSARSPAPPLDSRAKQATVKDNPVEFPSFPNLAPIPSPSSEQAHPSPIS